MKKHKLDDDDGFLFPCGDASETRCFASAPRTKRSNRARGQVSTTRAESDDSAAVRVRHRLPYALSDALPPRVRAASHKLSASP